MSAIVLLKSQYAQGIAFRDVLLAWWRDTLEAFGYKSEIGMNVELARIIIIRLREWNPTRGSWENDQMQYIYWKA